MKFVVNQPNLGLFAFRVFVGSAMAFSHGLGKIPPPEQMIAGVTALGFPLPIFFCWCAAASELLGGIFIALGLYTRYAAAFLMFTMGVAAFKVHAADPFATKEMALLYFMACILFILQGGGRFSLDHLIRKKP